MPLDRTALAALIGGLYPNNTSQAITPEDIRNGMNELVTSLYNITEDDASTISFTSTSPNITATTLVDGVNQAGAQLKTLQDESNVDGLKITGDGTIGSPLTVAEGGLDSSLLGFTSTNTNITATNLADGINQAGAQVSDLQDYAINNLAPSKATFLNTHKGKYTGSGFVHMGKHNSGGAYPPVNQGIWPVPSFSDAIYMGRGTTNIAGISTTDQAQVIVNNILIDIYGLNRSDPNSNPCRLTLPPAPDGLDKRDGSGRYDTLADAIAAGTVDLNESVINRQDLVLLEVWHEKISDKDVVYPRGLVQYGVSAWEGINLQTDNVAQGYSAQFEGDTATTGRSAVWSSLSEANKAKFIQDPLNNIYSDNGELIQVRARARVIRGLEGSWEDIMPSFNKSEDGVLQFAGGISPDFTYVLAQGKTAVPPSPALGSDDQNIFLDAGRVSPTIIPSFGSASTRTNNTAFSEDGQPCRVIPICLVDRLNQGAYHPVFNSQGAGTFWNEDSGDGQNSGTGAAWAKWHESSIMGQAAYTVNSLSVCFDKRNTNSARKGDIASNATGNRPDGGLYDSIKAGQIKDLRIDASGTHTPQTAHHTLSKRARNGEARGWEKVPRIRNTTTGFTSASTGTNFSVKLQPAPTEILGDLSWITTTKQPASGWLLLDGVAHKINGIERDTPGDQVWLYSWTLDPTGEGSGSSVEAVFGDYIDAPYSEGLFQNVTGTPAEIAATFPDGVMGEWIPVIPDGTYKDYKSTKKNLEQYQSLVTSDGGATWVNSNINSENTGNAFNTNQTAAQVRVIPFRAKANFTEEMTIDGVDFLYGNMGAEYNTKNPISWGSVLAQSLANIVPTDSTAGRLNAFLSFNLFYPKVQFETYPTQFSQTSESIENTIQNTAISDGIQWETRVTSQDNLASLIIPYRQIKHNGTSYGAGLAFNYVDNTSNTTDDNGQLIQIGTARSLDDMNIILKENFNV